MKFVLHVFQSDQRDVGYPWKKMYFYAHPAGSSLPVGRQAERARDELLEIGCN